MIAHRAPIGDMSRRWGEIRTMMLGLEGLNAVVTGGASGIGRACVDGLRAAGARVAVLDRDVARLASFEADADVLALACDVCDEAAVARAIETVEADLGPIGVLVAAAGVLDPPRPPERLTQAAWDRVFAVNCDGVRIVCRQVGPRMAARGRGSIVTVASIAGLEPGPLSAYGPSKAAMIALTRSFAGHWGRRGVRVNAVAPGYVRTPALDPALSLGVVDGGTLARGTALGRLAEAQEVACAVLFLASDAASAITGVVLPVDAGAMLAAGWVPHGGFPGEPA